MWIESAVTGYLINLDNIIAIGLERLTNPDKWGVGAWEVGKGGEDSAFIIELFVTKEDAEAYIGELGLKLSKRGNLLF